jgi:hypothetical protein
MSAADIAAKAKRLVRRSSLRHINPDSQISKNLSSPTDKNIPLNLSGKSALPARPVLSRHEGRIAIVTKRGRGCGGRGSGGAQVCSQGDPS